MPHYVVVIHEPGDKMGMYLGIVEASTAEEAIADKARNFITDDLADKLSDSAAVGMAKWIMDAAERAEEPDKESMPDPDEVGEYKANTQREFHAILAGEDSFGEVPAIFKDTELKL